MVKITPLVHDERAIMQPGDSVGLQISLVANLALAAGWTASAARSRSRRRELQEQRTMIPDDLKPEGRE